MDLVARMLFATPERLPSPGRRVICLWEENGVAAQVDGNVSPHGPLVALIPQVPPDGLEFFRNLCHRHRARFISHTKDSKLQPPQ